jgi:hypothetical protein
LQLGLLPFVNLKSLRLSRERQPFHYLVHFAWLKVSVYLCDPGVAMSQQLLYLQETRTVLRKPARECVPQAVKMKPLVGEFRCPHCPFEQPACVLVTNLLVIRGENVLRRGELLAFLEEKKCDVVQRDDAPFDVKNVCCQPPSEILSLGSNNGGQAIINDRWMVDNG